MKAPESSSLLALMLGIRAGGMTSRFSAGAFE
ncbi:PEP-CTERM sorting domain-containing protein [Brevibacterium sp. FME37]